MKARLGFVSNSSSSSFLVVFPNRITRSNVSTYFDIDKLLTLVKDESFVDKGNMSDQEMKNELEDLFVKLSDFSEETLLGNSLYDDETIDFNYVVNDYKARLQDITNILNGPNLEAAIYEAHSKIDFLKADYDVLIKELLYYRSLHREVKHKYEYSFGNESEYFDYPELEATLSDFQKDVIVCMDMNGWGTKAFCKYKDCKCLRFY